MCLRLIFFLFVSFDTLARSFTAIVEVDHGIYNKDTPTPQKQYELITKHALIGKPPASFSAIETAILDIYPEPKGRLLLVEVRGEYMDILSKHNDLLNAPVVHFVLSKALERKLTDQIQKHDIRWRKTVDVGITIRNQQLIISDHSNPNVEVLPRLAVDTYVRQLFSPLIGYFSDGYHVRMKVRFPQGNVITSN